jgi:capsular exopolysaccharide synthesis family protein
MSRIFEALQRSEAQRGASPLSPSRAAATDLLPLPPAERELLDARPAFPEFAGLQVHLPLENKLVCLTAAESLAAEKFRFLGVRLRQLQQQGRKLKKILVTSTIPEEGKSMVSANLAAALSSKKPQRVLLLEGDLRRPVMGPRLGLGKLPGISEWLQEGSGQIGNIYHLENAGFWLLPAGSPPDNPLELMQAAKLAELMEQLSAWFDWIVIDSPPVLPLGDTSIWARFSEGILLVTREGTTQKRQLKRGLEALEQAKLLGVVLNSCSNTDHSYYYYRYHPKTSRAPNRARQTKP